MNLNIGKKALRVLLMNKLNFSIVIPCYNESANLPELIKRAKDIAHKGGGEFIFVNNGSNDNSAFILNSVNGDGLSFINLEKNLGYGGGILAGIELTKSEFIGWTHADLQTPLDDILIASKLCVTNKVFIKGIRCNRAIISKIFSEGMGWFETFLFRSRLKEINAQPTLFHRSLIVDWNPPTDFSLDLYAYLTAKKLGFTEKRLNVKFIERKHGASNWNTTWKSRYRFVKKTIIYSIQLRKRYKNDNFSS